MKFLGHLEFLCSVSGVIYHQLCLCGEMVSKLRDSFNLNFGSFVNCKGDRLPGFFTRKFIALEVINSLHKTVVLCFTLVFLCVPKVLCFHFDLVPGILISFLISSLAHSSFNNKLFNLFEFMHLLKICLLLILSFIAL